MNSYHKDKSITQEEILIMAVTVKGESKKEELSTEEALEKRVESLNKMEADIKAKCAQLDKTAENLSAREASLQETFDQREKRII